MARIHALAAAAFAGALILTPAIANARINGPRITSFDFACGDLQDEGDRLRAEYARTPSTSPRRDEILARLREIGRTWQQIGCQAVFGSPVRRVNQATHGNGAQTDAGASRPPVVRRVVVGLGGQTTAPD